MQAKPRRRWLRRTAWIAVALVLISGVWLAVTGFLANRESQKLTDNLRAAETAASITINTPPFLTVDGRSLIVLGLKNPVLLHRFLECTRKWRPGRLGEDL